MLMRARRDLMLFMKYSGGKPVALKPDEVLGSLGLLSQETIELRGKNRLLVKVVIQPGLGDMEYKSMEIDLKNSSQGLTAYIAKKADIRHPPGSLVIYLPVSVGF